MKAILLLVSLGFLSQTWTDPYNGRIPDDFHFGAASASYQVEGGWDADGKGESIWDHFVHEDPNRISNNENGDVACDSYHKYLEDVDMLKTVGVNYYRFSISWPRILPTGRTDNVNQAGVDYYKNLIAALKENNIDPYVTLYHWDLPQALQEIGGWLNDELIEIYADYARLAFQLFGDDVQHWMTFNEPQIVCRLGYGIGNFAPGVRGDGTNDYVCAHNIIRAHARAYHIYDDDFRASQNGKISFVINTDWYEPGSDSDQDKEAVDRILQFTAGWYANPVYHPDGNYPQVMIDRIADRSSRQGLAQSRLPEFTQEEIDYVKGTYDFFSLNHYSTTGVSYTDDKSIDQISWDADVSVNTYWNGYFVGIGRLLNWIDQSYNHPDIVITENGYADQGQIEDQDRINYYIDYIGSAVQAKVEDGVNVLSYTTWSLMDDFEWTGGYAPTMGLYHVDFNDPDRTRTPKSSSYFINNVINTRCLVDSCVD